MIKITNSKFLLILCFSLFLFIPVSFFSDFHTSGEPREALSAQYMQQNSNYLIATRYGDELQTKPPLVHWLINICSLGKVSEFSSRLPAIILSIITILLFYKFLNLAGASHLSFLSCLVLLSSFQWLKSSTSARLDMSLASFYFISFFCFYFAYLEPKYKKIKYLIPIFLSAAFLVKGPVGVVLPFGVFAISLIIEKKNLFYIVKHLFLIFSFSSLLPFAWYYLTYQKMGNKFLEVFFSENFQRLAGSMPSDLITGKQPHEHSIFYLFLTLLIGFLPLFFCFIKKYQGFGFKSIIESIKNSSKLNRYFLVIVTVFLIFYSIPASKRAEYLLPIYPFLSFFIALLIDRYQIFKHRFIFYFCFIFYIVVFTASLFSVFKIIKFDINTLFYLDLLNIYTLIFSVIFFIVSYLLFKYRFNSKPNFLFSIIFLLIFSASFIVPEYSSKSSFKRVAKDFESHINSKTIYTFKKRLYGLNFYLNGRLDQLKKVDLDSVDSLQVIYRQKDFKEFEVKISDFNINLIKSSYIKFKKDKYIYNLVTISKKY